MEVKELTEWMVRYGAQLAVSERDYKLITQLDLRVKEKNIHLRRVLAIASYECSVDGPALLAFQVERPIDQANKEIKELLSKIKEQEDANNAKTSQTANNSQKENDETTKHS